MPFSERRTFLSGLSLKRGARRSIDHERLVFKLGVFLNGPVEVQFALNWSLIVRAATHCPDPQLLAMLCRKLSSSDSLFSFIFKTGNWLPI